MKILAVSTCVLIAIGAASCKSGSDQSGSQVMEDVAAAGNYQYKRFSQWSDTLEKTFRAADGDERTAALKLVDGLNRIAAFNLQALGRLYSSFDGSFKEFRNDFKDLEDAVGKYDMWNKVNHPVNRDKALDDLIKLLKKKDWVKRDFTRSRLSDHKIFLQNYPWKSYKKDKEDLVGQLRTQIKSVLDKTYDMSLLEDEGSGSSAVHGVHELRRELRWYLIEARVLNGMIQFKDSDANCPVADYQNLPTTYVGDPKYTTLPGNEPKAGACLISRCLFLAVNKHVETLGKIKDAAEQDANARQTNRVPQQLRNQAQLIFDEISTTGLTAAINKDLKKCD